MMWKWLSGILVAALVGLGALYVPPTVSMAQQSYPLEPFQCPAGQFTYAFNPVTGGLPGWFCAVPGVAKQIVTPPATTVGDLAVWGNNNGTSLIDNGTAFPSITVANNNGLKALPVQAAGTVAYRAGFATAGDGGNATYTFASSNCTISGGDNGLQVQPTTGTGCWLLAPMSRYSPIIWGAPSDGVGDATTALQAAISALQGKGAILWLGNGFFKVSSALSATAPIAIEGPGDIPGINSTVCTSGLVVGTANLAQIISMSGTGSTIKGVCIEPASGVVNTSGIGILAPAGANSALIQRNEVIGECIGIEVTGSATVQNVESTIRDNVILPANTSGCEGINIGASSAAARTGDVKLYANSITCAGNPNADGIVFNDSGGAFTQGNAVYKCQHGTKVLVGTGQSFAWNAFGTSADGDTSGTSDLFIDTSGSNAVILGTRFVGTWFSNSSGGPSVTIQNTANSPNIGTYDFTGVKIYMNTGEDGMDVSAGNGLSVRDSTICSNGVAATATGINISGTVSSINIQNSRIGTCDHFVAQPLTVGINLANAPASNNLGIITGNDFDGTTTPITWNITAPVQGVIADNMGLDNAPAPVVVSSDPQPVPVNPIMYLSGSATIHNMTGVLLPRTLIINPTNGSTFTFATGGAGHGKICTPYAATPGVFIIAIYDAGDDCWSLK